MSDHTHEHNHDHNHDHHKEKSGVELSREERMVKRLEHWIKHNKDHAQTYRDWVEVLQENGYIDSVPLLENAAEMTLLINKKFEKIIDQIKSGGKTDVESEIT
jgi:G3E family GTPase